MSSSQNFEAALRSDFKSMRVLATCSICDQLLYEPWTIACGHTYCYSCLCSWFSQDKRKKSCPECRLRVKVMPAPSFLIKQLVEVILKRSELLLADESVEQHEKKRAEEITLVDNDRNSSKGLFKGMFALKQNRLWRDNADGVMRCSGCGFEHEGGPLCSNCGEQIEIDDDFDAEAEATERETLELESMGFDLGQESDEDELFDFHDYHRFQSVSSFIDMTYTNRMSDSINHFRSHRDRGEDGLMAESDSEGTELSEASDSSESEIDDEDDSSLQGFIARDDENHGDDEDDVYDDDDYSYEATTNITYNDHHICQSSSARQRITETIPDDESDEGGAVSNRRQRRRHNNAFSNIEALSSNQSVITLTDSSSNESEISDHGIDAEVLRQAGWSPLHQDNESDKQSDLLQNTNSTPYASQDEGDSDTNTETLVDRNMSDDNEDDGAQMENCDHSRMSIYGSSSVPNSPRFYEFSESSNSQSLDEDRDTEMSDYRISRSSQVEKTSSTSYENHIIDQRIPYTEDIYRRARSGNSGTRRKRPAWDSLSQDAPEMDSVDTNFGSRRSKAWAISRMRNNYRENRQASPVRTEEISSSQGSHDHGNLQTETIGLANVIYEDVESDDSIQPPSRRHLRPRSSHVSFRRFDSEINTTTYERPNILNYNRKDNSLIDETEFRSIGHGFETERSSAYRNISTTLLTETSRNFTSLSPGITSSSSWTTRTTRCDHSRFLR